MMDHPFARISKGPQPVIDCDATMGKNHRHSKKLKEEKAKTHLKTKTKFLPKGQNVTDTAFKIRPIIVQEQLKSRGDESSASTKIILPVTDIVAKFKHNGKVKVEACNDLIHFIETTPTEEILTNLQLIMRTVVSLIQDRERSVRKAIIKLLTTLLKKVPQDKLNLFFAHISSNLRCAMTHMDKRIQEDSLLLLDALLEFAPKLIANSCFRILSDFLVMISKQRSNVTSEHTLSTGLSRKMTSSEWRIQVLMRLYRVLKFYIETAVEERRAASQSMDPIAVIASGNAAVPIRTDLNCFEVGAGDFSLSLEHNQATSTAPENWSALLSNLLSVLHGIWIEVKPEETKNKEVTMLNAESATVLSSLIRILLLIQKYISRLNSVSDDETTALGMEFKKLIDYLATSFPFMEMTKRNQSNVPKLVQENLMLIYLVADTQTKNHCSITKKMERHLNECLTSRHLLAKSSLEICLNLIDKLLTNSKIWHRYGFDMLGVIDKITQLFEIVDDDNKSKILKTLTKSNLFLSTERFSRWLQNLPKLFCRKELSEELITTILNLTRLSCFPVLEGLQENLPEICDNLTELKIITKSHISNEMRTKMTIIQSFLCVPNLSDENVRVIQRFIAERPGHPLASHFDSMLRFRTHHSICNFNAEMY